MTGDFTHIDEEGQAQLVDIGSKPDTLRRARARGSIHLSDETIAAIQDDRVGKGDVLTTARIGAINAVKHTWEAIPMCHQIPITNIDTDFTLDRRSVTMEVTVETIGKTGCEMEAIHGVSIGLNVIWDMVKSIEKDERGQYPGTSIQSVEVIEKTKQSIEPPADK